MTDRPDSNTSTPGEAPDKPDSTRQQLVAMATLLGAVLLTAFVLWTVATAPAGTVTAQDGDYYNDTNVSEGADDGWYGDGNATLDQVVDMVTRVPTYVIGTGAQDQSGTGYVGVLLTALLMVGSAAMSIAGIGVGPVGGTAVGLTVGFGLARIGLAPPWMRVLMLFGLGVLAAMAIRRGQGGR